MFLAELWRYPVKSMAGEALDACPLGRDGIPGDRIVHIAGADGRVVTSRSRPRLLLHRGRLAPDGEPLVDGRPWRDPSVAADVIAAAGAGTRLVAHGGLERFDVLPLLIATDGAVASIGVDRRRFRPNILVGGVQGLAERDWEGRLLAIGGALVRAVSLRQRCIMTTFDPDTAERDMQVLMRIHRQLQGRLALDAEIVKPGWIRVGDPVQLMD